MSHQQDKAIVKNERRRLRKPKKPEPVAELGLEEGSIFDVKSPAT